MLKIRKEQIQSFERIELQKFIEEIVEQVKDTWKEECDRLGASDVKAMVCEMVKRATGYGFTSRYDVARFVHLAFALEDSSFDSIPWISQILHSEASQRAKLDRVWRAVR